MKVFTPGNLAEHTGSKYLGVLVAAKYARSLNEFRRGVVYDESTTYEPTEKLTTTSLGTVTTGSVDFRLVKRRRPEV